MSGLRRAFGVLMALTLASPPLHLAPTAHAQTSSAVAFRTSADSVEVRNSPSLSVTSNLTVEAWTKPTSVVTGLNGVVSKPGYALALQPIGNGFSVVLMANIGGKTYSVGTEAVGPLGLGQWYHLAGTYDGSALRVFVNGVQLASVAQTGALDTSQAPVRIGVLDGSSIHFVGEIDEVRVSDMVRYVSGFTPASTPFASDTHTRGLWHLDEGSGNTTQDASTNANNGQLIGGANWVTDSPIGTPAMATRLVLRTARR